MLQWALQTIADTNHDGRLSSAELSPKDYRAHLKAEFVRLVVMRKLRRALPREDTDGRPADTTATQDLEALLTKYRDVLATIKVVHMNDSLFHRDPAEIQDSRRRGVVSMMSSVRREKVEE